MVKVIYALCTLTSVTCAWLLLRSFRQNKYYLLFWSGLYFVGLSLNYLLLILDRIFFPEPEVDLLTWRLLASFVAISLLLYGLVWEDE
jgi:Family of unknown function (DUF5985)